MFLSCRQPRIVLIYERATAFERGLSLDCIRHHYDSTQRRSLGARAGEATHIFWTLTLHDWDAYRDPRAMPDLCLQAPQSAVQAAMPRRRGVSNTTASKKKRDRSQRSGWEGSRLPTSSKWHPSRPRATPTSNSRPSLLVRRAPECLISGLLKALHRLTRHQIERVPSRRSNSKSFRRPLSAWPLGTSCCVLRCVSALSALPPCARKSIISQHRQ
jgi:hypothetical protein